MVQDIREIARLSSEQSKLEEKKRQIEDFFRYGGQFQQNQLKLVQASTDIVRNFYLLMVNGANLLKSLSAQIVILSLDATDQNLSYESILQELKN